MLAVLCAVCLLGSVTVRSLGGGTVAGEWRGVSTQVMVWLAVAACLGKMAGGFLGDRLGWVPLSVAALLGSSLLISVLVDLAPAAVIGMLVFQLTMAVTLKAMHHVIPHRPGLAFGLPCLALVIGSLPGLLGLGYVFHPWPLALALVGGSALLVAVGLTVLGRLGGSLGPRAAARR